MKKYIFTILLFPFFVFSQVDCDTIPNANLCPCPMIYMPVCGCDGITYSNDCLAICDGVTSWTQGVCSPTSCDVSFNYNSNELTVDFQALPIVVPAGTIINSYMWNFGDGNPSSFISTPDVTYTYLVPGIYTVTLLISTTNLCIAQYTQTITVNYDLFSIDGYVFYDDSLPTGLHSVQVNLIDSNNVIIDSIMSNQNGYYEFTGVMSGEYTLSAVALLNWGGVNSTDALLIQNYQTGNALLENLKLQAGDVNLSSYVNSTDGLLIRQRYVGMPNSFLVEDWIFESIIINISNSNYTQNIKGICSGDVNGSKFGY